MEPLIVDAKGELCPKPLILTKNALKNASDGQILTILIDNETSKQNVARFLNDNGMPTTVKENNGVFSIQVIAKTQLSHPDAQAYCSPGLSLPHCIAITSRYMGNGDDELGEILMKAFLNSIMEVSPLPSTLVFYNSGIFLTLIDSPVLTSLEQLQKIGVEILVCGTCLDYYNKKKFLGVGTISNMYTILEKLTQAGHVIRP